jgi:hypothetical protein
LLVLLETEKKSNLEPLMSKADQVAAHEILLHPKK